MIPFFLVLKYLGLFRVDSEEEKEGLDRSHCGRSAYNRDLTADSEHRKSMLEAMAGGGVEVPAGDVSVNQVQVLEEAD